MSFVKSCVRAHFFELYRSTAVDKQNTKWCFKTFRLLTAQFKFKARSGGLKLIDYTYSTVQTHPLKFMFKIPPLCMECSAKCYVLFIG